MRAKSALQIHYRTGVGEQLPLPDASFDAVYCCDVLEHVDDLGRRCARSPGCCALVACSSTTPSTAPVAAAC